MSMYLRLKRKSDTVFQHCEPSDKLQSVKEQVALVAGVDEDDIRLYEHLTAEKRAALIQQQLQERAAKLAHQSKSTFGNPAASAANEPFVFVQPPLDCDKKISELGLVNDGVIIYCYRIGGDGNRFEEPEVEGITHSKGVKLTESKNDS